MTHLLQCAERENKMTKSLLLESTLKTSHKVVVWRHIGVRERATQHRGEERPWRSRPDLRGMCYERWLKKWPDVAIEPSDFA